MDKNSDLVRRARSGDKQAFGEVAQQHIGMLIRIAYDMTGDYETAQELAQETILQAYLSLRHLRDDALFRSWLYGIGVNVCRSHLRARKIAPLSLEDLMGGMRFHGSELVDLSPTVEEIVEVHELHQRLLHALDSLTPADREAVLLFYYQGMGIREAAVLLDISPGALRVRLHKARTHLRKHLLAPEAVSKKVMETQTMLPVEVIEIMYFNFSEENNQPPDFKWPIILLLDEAHERVLPIWIGPHEAQLIQMILNKSTFPRPMTWGFVSNLIDAVGAQVESVIVSKLVGEVYYALTRLILGDVIHEIDARPSDAIGLALHTQSPIFVAEEVMSATGIPMGEKFKEGLAERKQLSRLSVEEMLQRFPPASPPADVEVKTQEEIEAANRESHERMKVLIRQ